MSERSLQVRYLEGWKIKAVRQNISLDKSGCHTNRNTSGAEFWDSLNGVPKQLGFLITKDRKKRKHEKEKTEW
jgi:hypothetical protein